MTPRAANYSCHRVITLRFTIVDRSIYRVRKEIHFNSFDISNDLSWSLKVWDMTTFPSRLKGYMNRTSCSWLTEFHEHDPSPECRSTCGTKSRPSRRNKLLSATVFRAFGNDKRMSRCTWDPTSLRYAGLNASCTTPTR
jgi:hypothetical protein